MTSRQRQVLAWEALGLGPRLVERSGRRPEVTTTATAPPPEDPGGVIPERADGARPGDAGSEGDEWESLRQRALGCRECGLCESRRQVVFGVGDLNPRWVVVGEAPGAEEDRRGEPFVGEAGQLLDQMLGSVGLSREEGVYILNVLKCRPPGNRDPLPDEIASCRGFLEAQIRMLRPRLIVAVGRFAAQALLGTDSGIGALRGREHVYPGGAEPVPVVVTYHPAYYLRRPEEKRKAWQDLMRARALSPP